MPERLTEKERSILMRKVHSSNTSPELIVRHFLHINGYRFRINYKGLPGHPDIVLPKYKTVIFIHGCFWHRHKGCKRSTIPVNNSDYWKIKFRKNHKRDIETNRKLSEMGWKVIIIWECQAKKASYERHLIDSLALAKS